jgi:HPt (histidine-containing phosphotransfer) domain-containing protein
MDHMMPEMDGMEATRIIREEIGSDYAKTIPIIALTANAVIGNEEVFLKRGFQAFLTKPIDMLRMDAVLRQWVRHKELERGLAQPEQMGIAGKAGRTGKADPEIDGLDWAAGLSRFGGDESIYLSVIHSYLTNTAGLLDKIREVEEESLSGYAITIHGIKGSSYGIEARSIGKKAEELEYAAKAGNLDFVRQNNPLFIQAAEAFLVRLATLSAAQDGDGKPSRLAPDEALLARMEEAAANFRIDIMEEVMNALEGFSYETQTELVSWLREQVDRMEFASICERLAQRKQEAHKQSEEQK